MNITAEKFAENVKKFLGEQGNPVGMHTEECGKYKKTHDNCSGCKYEIGCCKLVQIELLTLGSNVGTFDEIINATTLTELHKLGRH